MRECKVAVGWTRRKNIECYYLTNEDRARRDDKTKLLREENSIDETLQYYRADSIVEDCEFVRKEMLGEEKKCDVVLGQSLVCLAAY